ncbi:MAG: hypothetical protein PVI70_18630 [Gammaproteobacteria bacterium]|jgi:hypothetical protein
MASRRLPLLCCLLLAASAAQAAEVIKRQRPGGQKTETPESRVEVINPTALRPPPPGPPREMIAIPDRWRLVDSLGLVDEKWYDPYNQNTYKADKPIHDDWFLNLSLISDTVIESRNLPTPVGPQTTESAGSLDVLGSDEQLILVENLIFSAVYYKGDTIFRPPDYEYRFTAVANYNRVEADEVRALRIDPDEGTTRTDDHIGVQDMYVDKHLRNVSERYDFDSIRFGVQPITADFRGFLFIDNPFGLRLFGTRDNNIYQYNLAWFRRIEKDTNSGLNDLSEGLRDDDIFLANLYRQDFPVLGFTSQVTLLYNRNTEDEDLQFDTNGFLIRPASLGFEQLNSYDVTYLGYNGDGHFGRHNLSLSTYLAIGSEDRATFTGRESDVEAFFGALEYSRDYDWMRARFSVLYGSGDEDPFDNLSTGFDAVFENPLFAGADTSYWIRQPVGNIGGGGVALSGRNGILNSLRSSKEQGQSNFTNPGIQLLGFGMDFDLLPEWRVSFNLNHLWFATTEVLETARNQGDIDNDIGWDVSVSSIYRPFFTQNVVFRLSAAALVPGDGYEQMFGDDTQYSILANLVLTY